MGKVERLKNKNALRPAPKEKRKYSFGAIFGYPDPKTLPDSYRIQTLGVKNQQADGAEDGCGPYALTAIREVQEKVKLDPAFSMGMAKEGYDWKEWGNSLDAIAKASLKGFLEEGRSPYTFKKDGRDFVSNPANWKEAERQEALKHETKSWFWVGESSKYDLFDCIRSALYRVKDTKNGAITGVLWDTFWGTFINSLLKGDSGHCVAIIGWEKYNGEECLVIQNSFGEEFGDKGLNYFTRKTVNKLFSFGVAMFLDMPEDGTHESILEKSKLYRMNFIQKILNAVLTFIKSFGEYYDSR